MHGRASKAEEDEAFPGRDLRELSDGRDCRRRQCREAAPDNLADVPALRPSNNLPQDRHSNSGGAQLAVAPNLTCTKSKAKRAGGLLGSGPLLLAPLV